MQLTKNFKLSEFERSQTAENNGIDNTIPEWAVSNIKLLCERLLQPVRDLYGKPMRVGSGYRCKELNEKVKGSKTSDHMKGKAADIHCESPKKLLEVLLDSGLDFDQAILYPTFLHMSYRADGNRKMVIYK